MSRARQYPFWRENLIKPEPNNGDLKNKNNLISFSLEKENQNIDDVTMVDCAIQNPTGDMHANSNSNSNSISTRLR